MELTHDVQRLKSLARAPLPPSDDARGKESETIDHGERIIPQVVTGDTLPVMDKAAYHGLAGDAVRLLEPHTEADPVALLVSFLAEAGTLLNRGPHLVLDGCFHPLLFWPVLVGTSSKSRKGTAGKRIEAMLKLADPDWTRGQCKGNLSSGEGLCYAVRDAEYQESALKDHGRPTGETVTIRVDPGVNDKRLFLVQAEFGAVLRIMAREGNSLSGVLRDAWDGLDLAPMTKNNRIKATAPHIGIVGHVTKDELTRNLTDTEASNGFGNRFIWVAVKRSPHELPFPSTPDEKTMSNLAGRIGTALQYGRTVGRIGLTDKAREVWKAVYHDLSADRPGMAGVLLGRAEAQVMRLAALYAILDGNGQIDLGHLKAALALWEYAEDSTKMIFGDNTGDPVADTILKAVRACGELSETAISELFGRNITAARLGHARASLLSAGLIHPETIETGGRPRVVWRPGTKKTKKTN